MFTRLAFLFVAFFAAAPVYSAVEDGDRWSGIRSNLFGDRPIAEDSAKVVKLETPVRAEDAAIVPISIKTLVPQTPEKYIKKLYLVIDKNPSPVGAVFHFTPQSGRADIDTRVRIEEYSNVRAIAEMNDGKLFMATNFVKASGGCSAPAGKDAEAALARLGKMKFRVDDKIEIGQPNSAQLLISHPNFSGLAMDQVTRNYTPAYFVRKVEVSYAGKPIMTAEIDFTISEDPNFRFYFVPKEKGELTAKVIDTKDLEFKSSIEVNPATATARGS
ncbi:MAG: quinoprotein dehydrogenase-associated SoxYZ-like carrier [Burkholderiales bacterium]